MIGQLVASVTCHIGHVMRGQVVSGCEVTSGTTDLSLKGHSVNSCLMVNTGVFSQVMMDGFFFFFFLLHKLLILLLVIFPLRSGASKMCT